MFLGELDVPPETCPKIDSNDPSPDSDPDKSYPPDHDCSGTDGMGVPYFPPTWQWTDPNPE